jgi:aspartyl-tRNA(Asn)/glutamyl-tRNA(Gln) amidotransferase subunit A
MYLTDIMTVSANIVGVPSISVPLGLTEIEGKKLPLGLQIMAPQKSDAKLLAVANEVAGLIGKIEVPA